MKRLYIVYCGILMAGFGGLSCVRPSSRIDDSGQSAADSLQHVENKTAFSQDAHETSIDISLIHPDELFCGYPMRYKMENQADTISIVPTSENFDGFTGGRRYKIPLMVSDAIFESVEYLAMDAYVTNKSEKPLVIDKLRLNVEESHIDEKPYLYLATLEDYSNSMVISDEGWADYGEMVLEYRLLRKGEEFDGRYDFRKTIKRPEESAIIDFTPELVKMGYKWDYVHDNFATDPDFPQIVAALGKNSGYDPGEVYAPFEWKEEDEWAYTGFCRLFGRISFTDYPPVEFNGYLSLSTTGGFGAGFDYDDSFNLKLRTDGKDYHVEMPYVTTIPPNEAERVKIVVKCRKSSNHKFILEAVNADGRKIVSKPVKLHYMMPRHADKVFAN